MNRCAAIVTDQILVPPWGGNRVRILGIFGTLRALGWKVVLITLPPNTPEKLEDLVDEIVYVRGQMFKGGDIRTFKVGPFQRAVAKVVARSRPAIVIAEYAWLAPALLSVPRSALRCVDCHDLLFERMERFIAAGMDPWVICSKSHEIALLNCADIVIAIQHREEAMLRSMLPNKKVHCLLPHIELPQEFQRTSPSGSIVLAVGAGHCGNNGIRAFATSEWARVIERVPNARLQIAGRISVCIDPQPGIELLGEVADLCSRYATAAVVVCPIEIGTGAKIKTLEALRYGRAIVATPAAVEGLQVPAERAWVVQDSLSECAHSVAILLADSKARTQLENAAFTYGERYISREASLKQIRPILPSRWMRLLALIAG
jgi:glycosyltransferase involved in cell wall biosynthesis